MSIGGRHVHSLPETCEAGHQRGAQLGQQCAYARRPRPATTARAHEVGHDTRPTVLRAPGRTEEQVVLHVNTRALVERHGPRIELCRLNSGAVTQKNHPVRGHRSWLPIADYPYDEYRRRHGRDGALVEVTVLDAVPDILDLTDRIEGGATPSSGVIPLGDQNPPAGSH